MARFYIGYDAIKSKVLLRDGEPFVSGDLLWYGEFDSLREAIVAVGSRGNLDSMICNTHTMSETTLRDVDQLF